MPCRCSFWNTASTLAEFLLRRILFRGAPSNRPAAGAFFGSKPLASFLGLRTCSLPALIPRSGIRDATQYGATLCLYHDSYTILTARNPNSEGITPLDTASIIAELEAERDRLNSAIAALSRKQTVRLTLSGKPDGRKRKLSAAAKRRIGEAMKKRWAERKRKAA